MRIAYISGCYRPKGIWRKVPVIRWLIVERNICKARKIALKYWHLGFAVLCPHMNTAHFDGHEDDRIWLKGDLVMLQRCDVIVMMKGWQKSEGAGIELDAALVWGKAVIYE